jgi:hypothetical protein
VRDCRVYLEIAFSHFSEVQIWHQSHARCAQARRRLRVAILSKELKDFCCRSAQDRRLHHLVVIEELPQEVRARVLPEGFEVLRKLRKKQAFEFVEGYMQESGY